MAETIDEVSYDWEDEGKQVRRELKKEILTRGAWATVTQCVTNTPSNCHPRLTIQPIR